MDCAICQARTDDPVSMTCNFRHKFCFKCVLEYIEKNKELKSCPYCRGGEKSILLSEPMSPSGAAGGPTGQTGQDRPAGPSFYSTEYLVKSLQILNKLCAGTSNSCIVSEKLLLLYIKNKKQLSVYHVLKNTGIYTDEELASLINFEKTGPKPVPIVTSIDVNNGLDMLNMFLNIASGPAWDAMPGTGPQGPNPFR